MINHSTLVKDAAIWLRNSKRCGLVLTEFISAIPESPDAIGWAAGGLSIMVECKASRPDFLSDKKKPHRQMEGIGMERWYFTPPGLVQQKDIPAGWGLIESQCEKYKNRQIIIHPTIRILTLPIARAERFILRSVAWRTAEALSLIKPITITEEEEPHE